MITVNPLQNFRARLNLQQSNPQKSFSKNNLAPLKADTVSFSGYKIETIKRSLPEINSHQFPDNLYLDMNKIYETFENQRSYHRFEKFPFVLSELLVNRMNHLGITKDATTGGLSSGSEGKYFTVHESFENKAEKGHKRHEVLWTKEHDELERFFKKGIAEGGSSLFGAEDSMELIKEGLPKILKKQGWIK